MKRVLVILAVALLLRMPAVAQEMSESYYRENPSWGELYLWTLEGEQHLRQPSVESPFEEYALYGFSFVGYDHRGRSDMGARIGSISLHNPTMRYADYSLLSLLRRSPLTHTRRYEGTHTLASHTTSGPFEEFDPSPIAYGRERHQLRLQLSSRTYRTALSYTASHLWGDSVALSLVVGGRAGRDGNIDGLFGNDGYLMAVGERRWQGEVFRHRAVVALMYAPSLRSQRSWNTEEVFDLVGNPHYNSYWGLQDGRERSVRLRYSSLPTLYASWDIDDPYLLTNINLSTLVSGGRTYGTQLSTYEALTATPDHYTLLPSYQSDPEAALTIEQRWRSGRMGQIDWGRIYEANALSPEGAHYALFEERCDPFSAVANLSGTLAGANSLRVGVRVGLHQSHNYNTPSDLFGAHSPHPSIERYDYSVRVGQWGLYGALHRHTSWGEVSGSAEIGGESLGYRSATTHRSASREVTILATRLIWSHNPTDRLGLSAEASYRLGAPYWDNLYGSAEGMMERNPYYAPSGHTSLTLGAHFEPTQNTALHATLYGHLDRRVSQTEQFWDDVSSTYATLLAGRLDRLSAGAEASIIQKIGRRITLEGHFAVGSYRYTTDGVADIVSYERGKKIVTATRLHTKGTKFTSTPSLLGALKFTWRPRVGWLIGGEVAVVGARHVAPSLLLGSDYILGLNLTPEERTALTELHPLGTATSTSVFVYRKFERLAITFSVRNLLGSTEAYSDGYQPSRVELYRSSTLRYLTPRANRYQHIYPRHYYLTLSYDF